MGATINNTTIALERVQMYEPRNPHTMGATINNTTIALERVQMYEPRH